jgi:predicted hydrocarbon binding protein
MKAMAETFNRFSDQRTEISEDDDNFYYTITRCPICWGRASSRAVCYCGIGILESGLSWASGGKKYLVEETECKALGHENCVFRVRKEPLSG